MTIYIGNLSFQAEQEHLFDLFSEYGDVKNCSLPSTAKPVASVASLSLKWSTMLMSKKPSTICRMSSGWAG